MQPDKEAKQQGFAVYYFALTLPLLNYEEPMNKDVETQTDYSIKYLERKDSRLYFWQGIDKYENGISKYQKENINKLGCKRKLTLLKQSNF